MSRASSILIASNTQDLPSVRPVAEILTSQGCRIIDYQADAVAYGLVSFTISLGHSKSLRFTYDGQTLNPKQIRSAWFRRPTDFGLHFESEDLSVRRNIDDERMAAQQALWDAVPTHRWLNAPSANTLAGHKLTQLAQARAIGFKVPATVVANHREDITRQLAAKTIIFKGFYGDLTATKSVYTTVFENGPKQSLSISGSPYPGICQEYVPKKREWRITVVGDQTFDAIIDTSEDFKDDWRRRQDGAGVMYARGTFPTAEKRKCFALLRHYGLRFGAFDFVETPSGEIVFLEMNPNGQYGWLEYELGLPISEAIAAELLKIACGG